MSLITLLPDLPGCSVEQVSQTEEAIMITACATTSSASCPDCQHVSSRVHSSRSHIWGGEPKRCRIQADATRAWLLQCLREAEIVDASCHGAAREDYLQSALYLANNSLSLGEVLNEQVADLSGLRLLILSACQTAIPDVRGAENEVHSLGVGMLQAGVQAVTASLWSSDDRATYLLIVRFAQEWFPNRQTEPPAAALARAQQWLRNVTWEELSHW